MFDINEPSMRLLKMTESLLKNGKNTDENLNQYHDTAKKMDSQSFNELVLKVKNIKEHNHSLEEELAYLKEILKLYNQIDKMQYQFRSVYEKYSENILTLSDLNQIDIDVLNSRISVINGYLNNLKKINENKLELEKLSKQLILENKKNDALINHLEEYEDELKNNFINAEGRLLVNGEIKYTSVISEYQGCGLDVKSLLSDEDNLDNEFKQVSILRKDMDEKLSAAELCYNKMPNNDNQKILTYIKIDTIKARYKLSLIKILILLNKKENNYTDIKNKRIIINDLIEYRTKCLDKLNVKFSIDPFKRIKLLEQIDLIENLEDNSQLILNVRKQINSLNIQTEEMLSQNVFFLQQLNEEKVIYHDKFSLSSIDISGVEIEEETKKINQILPNQVVNVVLLSPEFLININRVREKAKAVILRVSKMLGVNDDLIGKDEIVPNLVIEASNDFIDNLQKDDLSDLFQNDNLFEYKQPFEEISYFDRLDDNVFIDDEIELTEDLSDFEDTKSSDFEDNDLIKNEEIQMPEAFWVTQEDETEQFEYGVNSLDEQIEQLLGEDNNSKLKK